MHYFSKYFFFFFNSHFRHIFHKMEKKPPFCNTSIFHIVKGSFCTFVTERSAYMEIFILREKKVE